MATFGTFTAGQVLTAAELNAAGTYTAYTPTITGVTIGNGTRTFYYTKFNKIVHFYGVFQLGSTSAVTGTPLLSLPVARRTAAFAVATLGVGTLADFGTATYSAIPISTGANDVYLFAAYAAATYLLEGNVTATVPFTWTTNDALTINAIYEAA